MRTRKLIFGLVVLIIGWPLVIAGLLINFVKAFFECGWDLAVDLADWISEPGPSSSRSEQEE